ncbi:MAG: hypothetical protein ACK4WF_08795, partial [Candidatus Brocadiales bacterium]
PGYGAQGAGAKELDAYFNNDGYGAIINSSRAIIFAYLRPPWKGRGVLPHVPTDWEKAIRQAVIKMHSEVAEVAKRAKRRLKSSRSSRHAVGGSAFGMT